MSRKLSGKQLQLGSIPAEQLEDGAVTWKRPVAAKHLLGNASVATINALGAPTQGDAYVLTDSGSLTAGTPIAVTVGDMVEFDGTKWLELVNASGGYPPAGTRALLGTQNPLIAPYTDGADDGKVVTFSGASLTGVATNDATDGNVVVVNASNSVFANDSLIFDGVVPTGTWSGSGAPVAGAGLTSTLDVINVGDAGKGVQVNANDIQVDASEIASSAGALQQVSGAGNEHLLEVKLDVATGGGESGLVKGANGLGVGANLAGNGLSLTQGSAMVVDPDSTTGGNVVPVDVTANGVGLDVSDIDGVGIEADGTGQLQLASQGNGIAGGGGSVLSLDPASTVTKTGGVWTFSKDQLQVTGVPDSGNDPTNKDYVDNQVAGLLWKNPVVTNLLGNVDVNGLVGNLAALAIEALSPSEGDAYVVSTANGAGALTSAVLGDIWQYVSAAWVKIVTGSGGFVPTGVYALLNDTTALIAPYTDGSDEGSRVDFDGSTLDGSGLLFAGTAGDGYVVDGSGASQEGAVIEWSGTAWAELVAGSGGFVPAGTRVVSGITPPFVLISPYVDGTDDGKILDFSGASNTGADTSDAVNKASVLFQDDAHISVYDNSAYVFEGTVPTGSWTQWNGGAQVSAGLGLSKSGNTINVGDVNKGVQANAADLQIDASEISGNGLAQTAGAGNEHLLAVKLDVTTGGGESGLAVGANGLGIGTAAAGAGLSGGGGSALAVGDVNKGVQVNTNDLEIAASEAVAAAGGIEAGSNSWQFQIKGADTSVSTSASGLTAAQPGTGNLNMTASVTAADDAQATATTVAAASAKGSRYSLYVNGNREDLREDKNGSAFISGDGGTSARTFANVVATDTIHWIGSQAGYELAVTDILDLEYNPAV